MSGLLLLAVGALWLWCIKWLIGKLGQRFPERPWRPLAQGIVFALLLPLPLMDEIVGGWQFNRLCEANVVQVNKQTARGRTVYREAGGHESPIPGTWVNVWKMSFRDLDMSTGEVIVTFDHLRAEGGRLFPGFDSGHDPLTFKGTCWSQGKPDKKFYADLGMTLIERPQSK